MFIIEKFHFKRRKRMSDIVCTVCFKKRVENAQLMLGISARTSVFGLLPKTEMVMNMRIRRKIQHFINLIRFTAESDAVSGKLRAYQNPNRCFNALQPSFVLAKIFRCVNAVAEVGVIGDRKGLNSAPLRRPYHSL